MELKDLDIFLDILLRDIRRVNIVCIALNNCLLRRRSSSGRHRIHLSLHVLHHDPNAQSDGAVNKQARLIERICN